MSMFTFGWGLMALWGAVQPLPEPKSQPGQSRVQPNLALVFDTDNLILDGPSSLVFHEIPL